MKILKTILLLVMGTFMFTQPVGAIISSTNASATTIEQQSSALKKEFKGQKKTAKLQKMLEKAGIDFKDPVKKWLWFGLALWLASAVMWALPAIWTLAGIVGLAGTICIIVWLVKEFG